MPNTSFPIVPQRTRIQSFEAGQPGAVAEGVAASCRARVDVYPGRLLSSALGDDLPRRIDDNAAIVTAARNSPQRCLQCGNLAGIEGSPAILVIPPGAQVR